MPNLTGGQALAKSLAREGISVVFGVPGAGQYEALDGLYEEDFVRYVATRHEQAASYMADGYARVTGYPAAVLVVPGPGMYNAMSGITGAFSQGSPMIVISGEGHADRPVEDDLAFVRGITKWAGKVERAADVPDAVHEAFQQMWTGRPGPVYLQVPHRVLSAEADTELMDPTPRPVAGLDPKNIEDAAAALVAAERLAMVVGGRVTDAAAEALEGLAEHLQAPVMTTADAKGSISDRHPLSMGTSNPRYGPMAAWAADRDVFLTIGPVRAGGGAPTSGTVISVDLEPSDGELTAVEIVGDITAALEALYGQVRQATQAREPDTSELDVIREGRFGADEQLEPQASFMRAIRAAMPDDGVLVQGMTQMGYYSRNYYPVYGPRTYLVAAHGTLGHAFPVALGAKIGHPGAAVVVVSGDGGFLYNSQELATAVQEGINVVTIVFNDFAYGNVLRAQKEEYDGHVVGTELHNPDFGTLAQTYAVRGVQAWDAGELETALRDAIANDRLTVIEVEVGPMERRY